MNYPKLSTLSIALLIGMGAAQAATTVNDDNTFFAEAARAGMFEIDASKLAAQHSSNPQVKDFAKMMISDHTKVAKELDALAKTKGVALPTKPSASQQRTLDELSKQKGKDFDAEYVEQVGVKAHREAVKLFTYTAQGGQDEKVKSFAAKNAPTLKTHLTHGQALQKAISGHSNDTPKGTTTNGEMGVPAVSPTQPHNPG